MRTTELGTTGVSVPVQGLGCMRLGLPGGPDTDGCVAVVDRAIDRGMTLLDTADMYAHGRSEEIVGRVLTRRRDETVLCTKFGVVRGEGDSFSLRGDAPYVRQACEASLRRLGVEHIDLYYLHRRDPEVPIEESVGAMAELVAAGAVRWLGLSEVTAEELREANAVHPISALQSEWNLASRGVEPILATCAELGVSVVPYSPQARGLFAGREPDAEVEHAALIVAVEKVAARHDVLPGQVALAWLHAQERGRGISVVALPGTQRPERIDELVAGSDLELDEADLRLLDDPAPVAAP